MKQTQPASPASPKIRIQYVDVPDVQETFVDAVQEMAFDGQTFRLVLGVTRMEEQNGDGEFTGKRYTACRVVLPAGAAMDLSRKLSRVLAAVLKQSMAGKNEKSPAPA